MKLNVYVPDELWSQARDTKSGSNPSQVVQAGLQALLAASTVPARLSDARPAGADESLERAAGRLLGDARAEFSDGYAAGLRLGEALPWAQLQKFARESQGDLRSWIKPWANTLSFEHAASQETKDAMRQALEDEVLEYDMAPLTPEQRGQAAAEHDRLMELFVEELADLVDDWSFRHRTWAWVQGCQQALRDLWGRLTGPDGEQVAARAVEGGPLK